MDATMPDGHCDGCAGEIEKLARIDVRRGLSEAGYYIVASILFVLIVGMYAGNTRACRPVGEPASTLLSGGGDSSSRHPLPQTSLAPSPDKISKSK